jgi:hypothetical protein
VLKFYDPSFVYKGKQDNVLDVEPANQDLTDSTYQYFGFISARTGSWIIQRFKIIGSTVQYHYAQGRQRSIYDAAWNATSGRYVGSFTFSTIDAAVPI